MPVARIDMSVDSVWAKPRLVGTKAPNGIASRNAHDVTVGTILDFVEPIHLLARPVQEVLEEHAEPQRFCCAPREGGGWPRAAP